MKRRLVTRTLSVLASLLLLLGLAACGSDSGESSDTTGGSDPGVSTDTTGGSDTTTTSDPGGGTDPGAKSDPGGPADPGTKSDAGFQITPGVAQNELKIQVGPDPRTYRLFLPADFGKGDKRPVVFFLHQNMRSHQPEQAPLYTWLDKLATESGAILVQPRAQYNGMRYGWLDRPGLSDDFIGTLFDFLSDELGFDTSRAYLVANGSGATYAARAIRTQGARFSGFGLVGGAQQATEDPSKIEKNRIYLSAGLNQNYVASWAMNLADALEAAGWTPGNDFQIDVDPGLDPGLEHQVLRALVWLDPEAFAGGEGGGPAPALDPLTLPEGAEGTTHRITRFIPLSGGGLLAIGLRDTVLIQDGTTGAWTLESSGLEAGTDLHAACVSDNGQIWVFGAEGRLASRDPGTGAWSKIANLVLSRDEDNRKPYIFGAGCGGDEIWVGAVSDVAVSPDLGVTWQTKGGFIPKQGVVINVSSLVRSAPGVGWLLALDGTVFDSADAGKNWSDADPDYDGGKWLTTWAGRPGSVPWAAAYDIAAPENGRLVVAGPHGITRVREADGTWNDVSLPTGDHEMFAVYFHDANDGCIAGAGGSLATTADGGKTWTKVETKMPGEDFGSVYCDGSRILVGGARGKIWSLDLSAN